jgi:O-acetyl-ADP-ribose deacetylase (regulator of RNase III)
MALITLNTPLGPYGMEEDVMHRMMWTFIRSLKLADEKKFCSISFPPIGAGRSGYENTSGLLGIYAIYKYLEKFHDSTNLRNINVVCLEDDGCQYYMDAMASLVVRAGGIVKLERDLDISYEVADTMQVYTYEF